MMALLGTSFPHVLLSTCKALQLECKVNKCCSGPRTWPACYWKRGPALVRSWSDKQLLVPVPFPKEQAVAQAAEFYSVSP